MINKLRKILFAGFKLLIKGTFLVIKRVFAKFIKIYILRLKRPYTRVGMPCVNTQHFWNNVYKAK